LDEGSDFDIDQILLIKTGENDYKVGTPTVEGARVGCKVLNHEKGKKIVVFKKKKRKGYRRKMGHRQNYSRIQVTEIKA
jgi:large subunit ribosomal protein L21